MAEDRRMTGKRAAGGNQTEDESSAFALDNEFSAVTYEEFAGEARDTAASLEVLIGNMRSGAADPAEGMSRIRLELQELVVRGRVVHAPIIELLLSRMANYVANLEKPQTNHLDDLETYLDVLRGILDGDVNLPAEEAEFVRSLPARRPADIADFLHQDIEIMLVEPQRTTARFVERELLGCGYRVCVVGGAFDALEQAVRTKPDLIIAAATLDKISGTDLGRALAAIDATHAIPFAILTSFDRSHQALTGLPENAAVLGKGKSFSEDLAQALRQFGIT